MFERDYLMREVQKIVQLLAKIARLKTESKHEDALREIGGAYERLGIAKGMLDYLDTDSLLRMVGSADVLHAIGRLMLEEASIWELQGDARADSRRDRAEVLIAAALAAGAEDREE